MSKHPFTLPIPWVRREAKLAGPFSGGVICSDWEGAPGDLLFSTDTVTLFCARLGWGLSLPGRNDQVKGNSRSPVSNAPRRAGRKQENLPVTAAGDDQGDPSESPWSDMRCSQLVLLPALDSHYTVRQNVSKFLSVFNYSLVCISLGLFFF